MTLWDKVQHANVAPRATATVSTDARLVARIEEKEVRLAQLRRADAAEDSIISPYHEEMQALAEEILELAEQAKRSEVTFVFHGIGRTQYYEMLAQHPPTAEQRVMEERAGWKPQPYNLDSFPPALMAASLVELEDRDGHVEPAPEHFADRLKLTVEIWSTWANGVNELLWSAVLVANQSVMETPKSLIASEIHRAFGPSSTTAPPAASPAASSSAGSPRKASRTGSRKTPSTRSSGSGSKA
jgi:hypothetical protein